MHPHRLCSVFILHGDGDYTEYTTNFTLCVDPNAPCYDPADDALRSSFTDGTIIVTWRTTTRNVSSTEGSAAFAMNIITHSPSCYNPDAFFVQSNCTGEISSVGNGECNLINDNEGCPYDGGDCCSCFGTRGPCGISRFTCLEPSVDIEPYICKESAPPAPFLP